MSVLKLEFDGTVYIVDEDSIDLGESHDAEQNLGVDTGELKGAGVTMFALYIGMRRQEPDRDPKAIADQVRHAKVTQLDASDAEKDEAESEVPTPGETGQVVELAHSESAKTPAEPGPPLSARSLA